MIAIPFDPAYTYSDNRERTQTHGNDPCIVCGRECNNPKYKVYVNNGFTHILTPREFNEQATINMGLFPIGATCLRLHPELKPYIQTSVV